MEEVHRGLSAGHVIVDRDHVQPVGTESLEDRCHFLREHCDVAGDLGVRIATKNAAQVLRPIRA